MNTKVFKKTHNAKEILDLIDLQMVSEAMLSKKDGAAFDWNVLPNKSSNKSDTKTEQHFLTPLFLKGNNRNSYFPDVKSAETFLKKYEIVAHLPNTLNGLSATLVREVGTNKTILSMRFTEFTDDQAISKQGWAFGQISDLDI